MEIYSVVSKATPKKLFSVQIKKNSLCRRVLGSNPELFATSALAVRRYNHSAISYPLGSRHL